MRVYPFLTTAAPCSGAVLKLSLPDLEQSESLILSPDRIVGPVCRQAKLERSFFLRTGADAPLAVGTVLFLGGSPALVLQQRLEMPSLNQTGDPEHAVPVWLALALKAVPAGEHECVPARRGPALAWITLSDKGAAGEREDQSGPAMREAAESALELSLSCGYLLPDDPMRLRALVADLALVQGYDLILTSGGTGVAPRDLTPEALLPIIDKRLPGFEQAMLAASLAVTPRGAISRAVAGVVGKSIVISLPGSRKAVKENLEAVLPALGHALEKLHGSPVDCGDSS